MSEKPFTDKDAAETVETLQPSLAQLIRTLVKRGETPTCIKTVARSSGSELIADLVGGAARYYKEQI